MPHAPVASRTTRLDEEPFAFLIGLSVLIIMAAVGVVFFNHYINRAQNDESAAVARVIDIVHRQVMLAHRAAALSDDEDQSASASVLASTLDELGANERDIREGLTNFPDLDKPAKDFDRAVAVIIDRCSPHILPATPDEPSALAAAEEVYSTAEQLIKLRRTQFRGNARSNEAMQRVTEGAIVGSFVLLLAMVLVPSLRRARSANARLAAQATEFERLSLVARLTKNAVIITDRDRRITWTNPAFTRITGYALDEVLGKEPKDFLQCQDTDPSTVRVLHDHLKHGEGACVEILNQAKDGRHYWLDLEIQPIRTDEGELVGFIAIESDITARRTAESRIVASERALSSTVAALAEGVTVLNNQGQYVEANPEACRMLGLTREQILDRNSTDARWITIREDGSPFNTEDHPSNTTFRTGKSQRGVVMGLKYPECAARWISINTEPIHAPDGSITSVVCSFSDITEQRASHVALLAARDSAEAASRAKSEFLANMSHEIRTPMTAILGYADLISTSELEPRLVHDATETIRRNGQHLLAIINDILDLSKIEAGKLVVERIATDPVAIAREVVELLRARAQAQKISLELTLADGLPQAIASDPVRLRQILMNIVGNAIKFTSQGGVSIRVGLDAGPTLRFEIHDTGIGMTSDQLATLFSPFVQADSSTTRRFGGTGLGLVISRRLAQILGGDVTAVSEPSRGSTFTLRLPAVEVAADCRPSPQAAPKVAPRAAGSMPLVGMSVLLAEDGVDNQRLISFFLRQAGAEVTVVENGRKAVIAATAEDVRFDVILMDMQMPELDGYCATRALRDGGVRTPIVALTAHAMSGDREKCIAAGCDDYATKPIDKSALLAVCERFKVAA